MLLRRSRRCCNYNRGLPFGLEGFLSEDIIFKLRPEDGVDWKIDKKRAERRQREQC